MEKKIYSALTLQLVYFEKQDVITFSQEGDTDDIGSWNSGWFSKNNS